MTASLQWFDAPNLAIPPFNPISAEDALDHGLRVTSGYSRWIDGGTLLGVVRDKKFIGHDTDVDIAVCLTTDEALDLRLPDNEIVRTVRWGHLPMQFAYLAHDTIVDLYFYYTDIEPGYLVNVNPEAVLRIPADLIFPIDENYSWHGHKLPVPAETKDYLAWSYGPSWTVPTTMKVGWDEEHANIEPIANAQTWQLPDRHRRLADLVTGLDQKCAVAVSERDAVVAQRDEALVQRDVQTAQTAQAVAERDEVSAQYERQRKIAARQQKAAIRAEKRLKTVQESHAWRAASKYYAARNALLRPKKQSKG